jgi:hypothetical protein
MTEPGTPEQETAKTPRHQPEELRSQNTELKTPEVLRPLFAALCSVGRVLVMKSQLESEGMPSTLTAPG